MCSLELPLAPLALELPPRPLYQKKLTYILELPTHTTHLPSSNPSSPENVTPTENILCRTCVRRDTNDRIHGSTK
jgi:hypothetical protein